MDNGHSQEDAFGRPQVGPSTRFYFDFAGASGIARDEDGMELPSLDVARRTAIAALTEVAKGQTVEGDRRAFLMEVRQGERTRPVLKVSLVFSVEEAP